MVCIGVFYIDRTIKNSTSCRSSSCEAMFLYQNLRFSFHLTLSHIRFCCFVALRGLTQWLLMRGVIILQNEIEYLENTEQLRMSSRKLFISVSCIRLDRAHRCWVLHAGTLVARILVSGKNWMCKHEGGSLCKANSGCNTNSQVPAVWVPACRAVELYPAICSSWRPDTAVRSYIAVPMFSEYSVPFCKIMTTNEGLPQKISTGTKTSPGEAYLVAKNCLPGVEMCLLLALTKSGPVRYKYQTHNENATQRFKDGYGWHGLTQWRSRDPTEEVYQYMMQKHHMHLLRCTEWQKRRVRQKATKFVICNPNPQLSFSLCYTEH